MFAFFAAGVAVGGLDGVLASLSDPVAIGIVAGLVLGKLIGIFSAAWLMDRFTPAAKDDATRSRRPPSAVTGDGPGTGTCSSPQMIGSVTVIMPRSDQNSAVPSVRRN